MTSIIKHDLVWKKGLTKRKKTDYIILHHSASKTGTVESIHKYHRNKRGWSGIGYNFVIYKDGTIHKGRGLDYVGAHCEGYNSKSIGICCIGDYTKELMPEAQYYSLVSLIRDLKGLYPNASIKGHRELANTACPGKYFPLEEMQGYAGAFTQTIKKENKDMNRYKTLADVPESYRSIIKKYVDSGVIKGHGNGEIDLSEDMCRLVVFMDRVLK